MQRYVKPIFTDREKKRVKYFLYLARSNCIQGLQTCKDGRYLYDLNSFADNNLSLIEIFQLFSHRLFELGKNDPPQKQTQDTQFNQLFTYMVELYHLQDQYLPNSFKDTEISNVMLYDIVGNLQEDKIIDRIKVLNKKMRQKYTKQFTKVNTISEKIARVRILKQSLKQKYASSILNIKETQTRQIYIPKSMQKIAYEHINKTLTIMHDIQFYKKKYRQIKLEEFLKSYMNLWKATIPQKICQRGQNNRQAYIKSVVTSRYTKVQKVDQYYTYEVLITLRDLLNMKKEQPLDRQMGQEIMRQLGKTLKDHRRVTGKHYPLLHPKDIIINQIQLKVHLSHTQPLLSALGLLCTPMTYEQMIAFATTPQTFDPYSAPIEHLDENSQYGTGKEIFYGFAYGLDNLLKDPRTGHKFPPMKFQGNDMTMSQVKQQCEQISEGWRFTMIGSYLLNGSEYHKRFVNSMDNYENFKNYLRKEKDKYDKNIVQYIQTVLNFDLNVQETRKINDFSLSIFDKFLGEQEEDSDLQQVHRFFKFQRIIRKKQVLSKNIVQEIISKAFTTIINNQKKHLILFYLSLFSSLFHIKTISQYAIQDFNKCKEMVIKYGKDIGINHSGEDRDHKLYIEVSSSKLKQYKDKSDKQINQALNYLDKAYSLAYRSIEQRRKKYYQIKEQLKEHFFSDKVSQKQQVRVNFQIIINQVNPLMKECRTYIMQIVQRQLAFPKEIAKEKLTKSIILLSSFHMRLSLFLTITRQNFLALEALVLPLIHIAKINEKEKGKQKEKEKSLQTSNDESFEFNLYALELLKQYQLASQRENASQNYAPYPIRSESEQISLQQ